MPEWAAARHREGGGRWKVEGRWKGAVRSDGGWLEEELYRVGAKVQRTEDGAGGCCV